MRVLVDTNVLLAALATRGVCAELLEHVWVHHQVLLAEVVIDEVAEKLTTKFRVPVPLAEEHVAWLRQ